MSTEGTKRFINEKSSLTLAGFLAVLLNGIIAGLYFFNVITKENWQFGFGDAIVTATLVGLVCISLYTVWLNNLLFTNIGQQIEQLQLKGINTHIFQTVQQKYLKLKQNDGLVNVNIPSFLEEFMGEYKVSGRFLKQKDYTIPKSLKFIQMFVSMAILIGVLGTFIGLIVALGEMGSANSEVLNGINTAFYTSVAGILNSLLINVSTRIKNTDQAFVQLLLNLENGLYASNKLTSEGEIIKALQDVSNNVIDLKESFVDIATFSKELKLGASSLQKFNQDFGHHTDSLKRTFSNLETVSEIFNQRTNTLHMDMEKMLSFLNKSSSMQLQTNEATNQLVNVVSAMMQNYENLSTQQLNILSMTEQNLRIMETEVISSVKEIQHSAQNHQTSVNGELQEIQKSINDQAKQQFDAQNIYKEQLNVVEALTYNLQDILKDSHLEDLQKITTLFNDSIQRTVNTISTISYAMQEIDIKQTTQVETMSSIAMVFNDGVGKVTTQTEEIMNFIQRVFDENQRDDQKQLKEAAENLLNLMEKQDERNFEQFEQLKVLMTKQLNQENEHLLAKLNDSINELSRYLEVSNKNMDYTLQSSIKGFKEYIELTNSLISNKLNSLLDNQFMLENIGHIQLQKIMQDLDKLTSKQ